ncbi:MAG: transposase [Rubrivivax sp.]
MTKQPFPEEFKIEAVKQITERGHKVAEVSARCNFSDGPT